MTDPDGRHSILIETLDRKRRKRYREAAADSTANLELIPVEWRELLTRWVRRGGKSRWDTLLKDAGTARLALADALRDWLVREGWAIAVEEHKLGEWWPQSLELRELTRLRTGLGISDRDQDALRWQAARAELETVCGDALAPALLALDELPVHRALARCDLIHALQRWQDIQQSGTRRDFALAARNDTKGISESEWNWLEQVLDPAEFRIERHTPLLLIAAPLTLILPNGRLDLASCSDFAALTPATVHSISSISGRVTRWQLIENRTSFERIARNREQHSAVIWLPGFPPGWWCNAVGHLLDLLPAPVQIACDPDPAGIAIAIKAAELWQQRALDWQPWRMSAGDVAGLRVRKPLTEADRQQLAALLPALPREFSALAEWLLTHNEKGEQEGYL